MKDCWCFAFFCVSLALLYGIVDVQPLNSFAFYVYVRKCVDYIGITLKAGELLASFSVLISGFPK